MPLRGDRRSTGRASCPGAVAHRRLGGAVMSCGLASPPVRGPGWPGPAVPDRHLRSVTKWEAGLVLVHRLRAALCVQTRVRGCTCTLHSWLRTVIARHASSRVPSGRRSHRWRAAEPVEDPSPAMPVAAMRSLTGIPGLVRRPALVSGWRPGPGARLARLTGLRCQRLAWRCGGLGRAGRGVSGLAVRPGPGVRWCRAGGRAGA